jgi:hypothetical protein
MEGARCRVSAFRVSRECIFPPITENQFFLWLETSGGGPKLGRSVSIAADARTRLPLTSRLRFYSRSSSPLAARAQSDEKKHWLLSSKVQLGQREARITPQKLPRWKSGSLSARTSALTVPYVVSGLCDAIVEGLDNVLLEMRCWGIGRDRGLALGVRKFLIGNTEQVHPDASSQGLR